MRRMLAAVLSLLFLLPLLGGCGATEEKQRFVAYEYRYFDTVTQIIGYADSKEEFDGVVARITELMETYHEAFDIYYSYSIPKEGEPLTGMRQVNQRKNAVDGTMAVSDTIYRLLEFSLAMYDATEGRTNIAMGAVLRLWHDCREMADIDPASAELPDMEALIRANEHTDIRSVLLDPVAKTVTITDDALMLDVGAIAKGYAAERIAQTLLAEGVNGYLISLGGNVRTIGTTPDGKGWRVGVENPIKGETDPYLALLRIEDGAVVVSGSYQRNFEVDGVLYHHIIDPDTLMPENRYLSVAVIATDSGMGDAFSTALFNLELAEGMALVEATEGLEAFWVMPDGTTKQSSGFAKYVE